MNQTHYYCDVCKKEFKHEELGHIKVEQEYSKMFKKLWQTFDVCESCGIKIGLQKADPAVMRDSQKTTAEQIYEIIAQIVYENQPG